MVIKGILNGSPADHLGVKVGWRLHAIAGEPIAGKDIYQSYRTLVVSSAPLRSCMLVRPTPLKTDSAGMLATKLESDDDVEVAKFLSKFGVVAQDAQSWGDHTSPPDVRFTTDGHREMGKPIYHTWYAIVGKICAGQGSSRSWMVERRLTHVRSMLYEPLRRELGETEYNRWFKNWPFPWRGAPPGTTARLRSWLTALSEAISFGAISPSLTASIFRFLEAPTLHEDAGQSVSESVPMRGIACVSEATRQLEVPCTIQSVDDRTHQGTNDDTSGVLDASMRDASENEPDHGREMGVAKMVDAQAHSMLNNGLHHPIDVDQRIADDLDDPANAEQPWACSQQEQAEAEADAGPHDSAESSEEACSQDVLDDGTEQGSDDGADQGSDDGVETGVFEI